MSAQPAARGGDARRRMVDIDRFRFLRPARRRKEIAAVSGAGKSSCYDRCGGGKGNPSNYKSAGTAGEKGGKFTAGCHTIGGNGRAVASAA